MFPYLMLLASATIVVLALFTLFQGDRPTVRVFAILLVAVAIWVVSIAGWSLSPSPAVALTWFRLQFLGVAAVPVLLYVYALLFAGNTRMLRPRSILLLLAVPLLTLLITWSPIFHRLMFTQVDFALHHGIMQLETWVPGPWFVLHSSYSFGLVVLSVAQMAQTALRSQGVFRHQILILLIMIIPAIIIAALNTLQLLPPTQIVTPLGFLLFGVAIVAAILRYQMHNAVPIARDLLIEQIADGMLVLDRKDRIVDLNPVMQELIGRPREQLLGHPLAQALAGQPELRATLACADTGHAEVELRGANGVQHYDLQLSPLMVQGETVGKLVVLHNISRLKAVQSALFVLATTDTLTGLDNRHQFFELARPQLALAIRQEAPVAGLLFDIDHFKRVNDKYGHEGGDLVLATLARRFAPIIRRADVLCRYGGEEFAALLVNADRDEALSVAERLRRSVADEPVELPGGSVQMTISVGVALGAAGVAVELADLLRQADQALYQAKGAGRNCVAVFGER